MSTKQDAAVGLEDEVIGGRRSRGACLACEAVVPKGTSRCTPNFCQRSMLGPVPLPVQERA
jgi:hypothetical protein